MKKKSTRGVFKGLYASPDGQYHTEAIATLVNLTRAESVEAGGSRRRWRAHPAPSPHPVMRSASLGGRAR
eukprot:scaffold21567_cov174-Isochrysis_galbana.AAC.1